jgi:hypothetical protein
LGPVLVGGGVWCAASAVAPVHPDVASVRAVVAAPAWVPVVAALIAALIPAFRRRPLLASPAVLAILPFLPLPLPAAGLLWTGPLAWLPIGLSLAAAAADVFDRAPADSNSTGSARNWRAPLAAGALTLGAGLLTAWAVTTRVPGGDEPHYLMITQSLLYDGDLDIQNNFDQAQYRDFYAGPLPRPDVITRGAGGEAYSIHAPGTAVLVLPAFAAWGYAGAKATMLLLAAVAGALIWIAARASAASASAAWFASAAIVGSATFLLQSGMIFPDLPGAAAAAAGAWLLAHLGRGRPVATQTLVAVSGALSALPWLHTRFAVLAGAIGLLVVAGLWRLPGADRKSRARRLAAFLAVPAVSAVAWLSFFHALYGTINPAAPYGPDSGGGSWRFVPGGLLALLLDGQYGLLVYTPILGAAILGARSGQRSVLVAAGAYLAIVTTYWMWWGGLPSTPARFATAALPLAAAPLAAAWARADRPLRAVLAVWLLVSMAIATCVIAVSGGLLAWNFRDAQPRWLEWLGPVVNLPRAWPSFFWELVVTDVPDLASEWPFVLHAAVFTLIVAASSAAAVWTARRRTGTGGGRAVAAGWGTLAGLTLAAATGWALTGSTGLDPARAQLAVLEKAVANGGIWTMAPLSVTRRPGSDLRIRGEEAGLYGPQPWAAFASVPPGIYDVRVFMRRPAPATATVLAGQGRRTLTSLEVASLSEQAFAVRVPAAGPLVITADREARAAGARVEIRRLR